MDINQEAFDNLVFGIVRDLDNHGFDKNATRQDINMWVLEHFEKHISEYVLPSIERLVDTGRILEDRDTAIQGRPYRYYLPNLTG